MKNLYTKEKLLEEINQVRKEIGHEELEIHIKDIYYNEKEKELWIITKTDQTNLQLLEKADG